MKRGRDKGTRVKGRRGERKTGRRTDTKRFQLAAETSNLAATQAFAQTREVRKLLEGIGTPPATPFKPDPFQLEALAVLEFADVLVTAPTGSGKTWIAREEIRRLIGAAKRAWYTSPIRNSVPNSGLSESAYSPGIAKRIPTRL